MSALQHRRLWGVFGAIAIVLVICGVGAQQLLQGQFQPPTAAPFLAAHAKWEQRPFQKYRLVVSRRAATCQQTLDVVGLVVEKVIENECTLPFVVAAQTVDQLFTDLESYALTYHCGINGCGCDWSAVSVIYHPQWGYPQQVSWRQRDAPWWQKVSRMLQGKFGCTLMGEIGSNYSIDELIPNPTQP